MPRNLDEEYRAPNEGSGRSSKDPILVQGRLQGELSRMRQSIDHTTRIDERLDFILGQLRGFDEACPTAMGCNAQPTAFLPNMADANDAFEQTVSQIMRKIDEIEELLQ